MSKLEDHISEQQDAAARVTGLLDALLCLKDNLKSTSEAEYAVTMTAYEIAKKLSVDLDTVNLPEGGDA